MIGADHRRRQAPFGTLLIALVLFIVLIPIMGSSTLGIPTLRVGFSGILIAGLWVANDANEGRKVLTVAAVLVLFNLCAQWFARLILDEALDKALLKSALSAIYLGVLAITLMRTLIRERSPSSDTLVGGINVYLLMALMFAELHIVTECLTPGSYQQGGVSLVELGSAAATCLHTPFVYFSFVTITTLGYGDVIPVTPSAQFLCAAEAVAGQLYVAILIGGLVALWISNRGAGQQEPGPVTPRGTSPDA